MFYVLVAIIVFCIVSTTVIGFSLKRMQKESDARGASSSGKTGAEVVRHIFEENNIGVVKILKDEKDKRNAYSSIDNKIILAPDIHDETSVLDVAVAAHEASHALQDKFLDVFNLFRVVFKVISSLCVPFFVLAFILDFFIEAPWINVIENYLWIGIFGGSTLMMFMTLFVEADASVTAIRLCRQLGLLRGSQEYAETVKFLTYAFATYFLTFINSIAWLYVGLV